MKGILRAAVTALSCAVSAAPAIADYTLEPGDTVQLSVASVPELRAAAMVDIDGVLRLPLIPPLKASGLTLDALLAQLRTKLPQQTFHQRQSDGRDNIVVVDPDEISVDIAEYRPIYVRGDVAKPGDQRFKPGLTVRQAIALAGGYDVMRFHMENPFLQASDLRAEYEGLWTDFARQQAHAMLIQAELDGRPAPDLTGSIAAPIPRSIVNSIVKVEAQQVAAQNQDYTREGDYLMRSARSAQEQGERYAAPRDDAKRSEQDDVEYKEQLRRLLDKGVIAHDRVADQQKSLLESTQRFLEYSTRISDLKKSQDDFERQSQRLQDQHRAALLTDLQDTNGKLAVTRGRLQAVGEKLLYTGAVRSQLVNGTDSQPTIEIHHASAAAGASGTRADEDTVLSPGDVVEISLRVEMAPDAEVQ